MISVSCAASNNPYIVLAHAVHNLAPLFGGIDATFCASVVSMAVLWPRSICVGATLPGTVPTLGSEPRISGPSEAVEEVEHCLVIL